MLSPLFVALALLGTPVFGALFETPTDELLKTKYDIIVIGGEQTSYTRRVYTDIETLAGAGGAVMANRLTEDPKTRVLLIEAGGRQVAHACRPYNLTCFYDHQSHDITILCGTAICEIKLLLIPDVPYAVH